MGRRWKTKLVIWSRSDPEKMTLGQLADSIQLGLNAILTSRVVTEVPDPQSDPDAEEDPFFIDPEEHPRPRRVALTCGFEAVPIEAVTLNGYFLPQLFENLHPPLSNRWALMVQLGGIIDGQDGAGPYVYHSLEECQAEVDILVKLGEWSCCNSSAPRRL